MSGPDKFCVDNRCVEIPYYLQGLAESYNQVSDDTLCFSQGDRCAIQKKGKRVFIPADARTDRDRFRLLLETVSWGPEFRRILRRYATEIQLPEGYQFQRLCPAKGACPPEPPAPETLTFHSYWVRRMDEYFGVTPDAGFPQEVRITQVFGVGGGGKTVTGVMAAGAIAVYTYHRRYSDYEAPRCAAFPNLRAHPEFCVPDSLEAHELTHAYLTYRSLADHMPRWLGEVLSYGLEGDLRGTFDVGRKPSEDFFRKVATVPVEQALGFQPFPNDFAPHFFGESYFALYLTITVAEILLEANPDAIRLIGQELFATDLTDLSDAEKKQIWVKVIFKILGVTPQMLVTRLEERIHEELGYLPPHSTRDCR